MRKLKVGQRKHLLHKCSNHCIGSWCVPLITCPSLVGVKGTDYVAKADGLSLSSPPSPFKLRLRLFLARQGEPTNWAARWKADFFEFNEPNETPRFLDRREKKEKINEISDPRGTLPFLPLGSFFNTYPALRLFNDRRWVIILERIRRIKSTTYICWNL